MGYYFDPGRFKSAITIGTWTKKIGVRKEGRKIFSHSSPAGNRFSKEKRFS